MKKERNKAIFYGKQYIDNEDIKSVTNVLRSNFLTQGPYVEKFENKLKKKTHVNYAVSANSATSCLMLACRALGIKKNDLVWTSPNTFVSTANAAVHCGAKIDLVDIDLETGNISIELLKKKLLLAKKKNKLPKLIMPVHFAGQPTEQKEIWKLSKKYGFKIIEDASHSIGAKHYNEVVGSCKWSDIVVMSFHPVKPITTGEGGVALTNNKSFANTMKLLRTHGIEKNLSRKIKDNIGDWYYEHRELGYNFRLSDIHASLGTSQLKKLKFFTAERNKLAKKYNKIFSKIKNIVPLTVKKYNISSYHLYVIRIISNKFNIRNKLIKFLKTKKIYLNIHYIPIQHHPYYKRFKLNKSLLKNSEIYFNQALSIPLYVGLSHKEQLRISNCIINFINKSN
ncbi:UDP-4-amino-4,6-dideoxy-N-acetyl-beta-L-altrosamine transaminase [Candidatus Pelagibacter sp.]|nr:UDP-4-amino-4,6-dideoxy-N-acetyl-beta-L-altrosamine transaminase [Candidatus Pelagibacter sp.]